MFDESVVVARYNRKTQTIRFMRNLSLMVRKKTSGMQCSFKHHCEVNLSLLFQS